jgi:hypothetical protein
MNQTGKFCAVIKDKCKGEECVFGAQAQCALISALASLKNMEMRVDRIAQLMGKSGGISS